MHIENPQRTDFRSNEIVDRVATENIFGHIRPGVIIHVNQHCVANKRPNPGAYRMLSETARGRRRVFRDGADFHPYRGGKKIPDQIDIPERYWHLLDWYHNEYNQ